LNPTENCILTTYHPSFTVCWWTGTELVAKVKPKINSVEVHPQLSKITDIQWMVCWWVLVHRARALPVLFAVGFSWLGWAVVCQS
jgi:hypothetical protein